MIKCRRASLPSPEVRHGGSCSSHRSRLAGRHGQLGLHAFLAPAFALRTRVSQPRLLVKCLSLLRRSGDIGHGLCGTQCVPYSENMPHPRKFALSCASAATAALWYTELRPAPAGKFIMSPILAYPTVIALVHSALPPTECCTLPQQCCCTQSSQPWRTQGRGRHHSVDEVGNLRRTRTASIPGRNPHEITLCPLKLIWLWRA